MIDSTVLVERLVASDDECKRRRLEVERLQLALEVAEKDASSLRGSCRALGEELKHAKARANSYQRSLSWLMHNRTIAMDGIPGWLLRALKSIIKHQDK